MKKIRSKYSNPDFQFVRFSLAGHEFGLDVSAVREIIKYRAPAPGGNLPFAEGYIRVRSMLVPVIDLKKRFSLPQTSLESSMIIIGLIDSLIAGLIVDKISDITLGAKDFTLSPGGTGFPWDHLVEAEVESEDSHVLILNADGLLTPEEKAALSSPLEPGGQGLSGPEMGLKKPDLL
jgi:purine-binding chemotaxis protein CheW